MTDSAGSHHFHVEVPKEPLQPTVFDVTEERLARIYAEALIAAAEKAGDGLAVVDELRGLTDDVFRTNPDIERFFSNLAVSRERKSAAIKESLTGKASDVFLHFLLVLNEHNRLELLRAVLAEATAIIDRKQNKVRVHVRSAVPLPEDQRAKLLAMLESGGFRRAPIMEYEVDPDLIGGLILRVDDWQVDASIRTQLDNLRTQLIEKGSHEIQGR